MACLGYKDLCICDDGFYEIAPLDKIRPGHLVYVPTLYPDSELSLLQILQADPTESHLKFKLSQFSHKEALTPTRPILTIGKGSSDFYLAKTGKIRQAVVMNSQVEIWNSSASKDLVFFAPKFTFKQNHTSDFVIKVQTFQYNDLFYLPPDSIYSQEESAIRFEHLQSARLDYCKPVKTAKGNDGVKLADDAYKLLLYHFMKWHGVTTELFGRLDVLISNYKDLVVEEYQRARIVVKK